MAHGTRGCSRAGRRSVAAIGAALLLSACALSENASNYVLVLQDRWVYLTCPELLGHRDSFIRREKELAELSEKAESAPGGIIVSYAVYRSELVTVRSHLTFVARLIREKGCEKPPAKPG